jgi:Transglutaminase-like superfamily
MSLNKKLQSFANTSREFKLLFLKTIILSAFVKFSLVFLPFRKVLTWQGKSNIETTDMPDEASLAFRKTLQSAIQLCDKYTFWKTECYTQALTAKILLNNKRIPATVYIGFKKDEKGNYEGHAWLRSYDRIITGGERKEDYIVHSFYS